MLPKKLVISWPMPKTEYSSTSTVPLLREYNLALGERRANAVKQYLVSLGVAADRISTISYGKERPAVLGSNEAAWAQNRRAVTVVRVN